MTTFQFYGVCEAGTCYTGPYLPGDIHTTPDACSTASIYFLPARPHIQASFCHVTRQLSGGGGFRGN